MGGITGVAPQPGPARALPVQGVLFGPLIPPPCFGSIFLQTGKGDRSPLPWEHHILQKSCQPTSSPETWELFCWEKMVFRKWKEELGLGFAEEGGTIPSPQMSRAQVPNKASLHQVTKDLCNIGLPYVGNNAGNGGRHS